MNEGASVGKLRQQSALCDASREVVLVPGDDEDEDLKRLVLSLEVVMMFPDTCDQHGVWRPVFKVQVGRRR